MLADSHCHFETKESAAEIIARAQQAGVAYILDAGDNLTHLAEHLDMVQGYPTVYTAAGAHPHQALEFSDLTAEGIVEAAAHEKVIAIGEAGLDYFYDFAPREAQIRLFKENIKAVGKLDNGLTVYLFNYQNDKTPRIGLIAQEVRKVKPEAVCEDASGFLYVRYDWAVKK